MQAHGGTGPAESRANLPQVLVPGFASAAYGKKLKDENADSIVRKLAALVVDEIHSDAGDATIKLLPWD